MRRLLRAFAITVSIMILSSCSCLFSTADDWKTHDIIAEYPTLSRPEIHAGLEQWIPELTQQMEIAIMKSRLETGIITASGSWRDAMESEAGEHVDISYLLLIDIEENQARYRLDSLRAVSIDDGAILEQVADSKPFHIEVEARFQHMVSYLSRAIQAESADW